MKLSKEIEKIFLQEENKFKVSEILSRIEIKSFGILLSVLALPSALPVPAPGYSIPFGLALTLISWQFLLNRNTPWLPEKVLNKEIKTKKNNGLIKLMVKFLEFFENFLKPRKSNLIKTFYLKFLIGIFILLSSISMLIPIPLTNTGPALGIFLIGLGLMEEDFWFVLFGIFVCFCALVLSTLVITLVILFGNEIIGVIKNYIYSLT